MGRGQARLLDVLDAAYLDVDHVRTRLIETARIVTFAAALALALPAVGAAQLSDADRAALADLSPSYAERFTLTSGWFRGRPIRYFDFGPAAVTLSPLFLFVTGFDAAGRAQLVPGQHPVFGSVPGVAGYSPIWQVHFVVVPPGYVPNAVTDARTAVAMALRGAARLVFPGIYANCPIVPSGSTLEDDPAGRTAHAGWYKGHPVEYFDFGQTPLAPAPIYAFVTGFADGAPQFLRAQHNIVDVVPGGPDPYRDMWDVHVVTVGTDYAPDRLRDTAALLAEAAAGRLRVQRAGVVRNCPVVIVDGRPAPRRPLMP